MPDRRLIEFARDLRKNSTDAERRIWFYLRAQRLGGHAFRRQHPIGDYIADFYCHSARLVIELDGGQHFDPQAAAYDARRTQAFADRGVKVIRFGDVDALRNSDAVAESILREVNSRLSSRPPPHPSPGIPGEGENADAAG